MRQLLVFFLVYLIGIMFSRSLRGTSAGGPFSSTGAGTRGSAGARPKSGPALVVPMVQCATCGVHLPKGEAVVAAGDYFCGAEHAEQARMRARAHEAS
jgi:uncharacterized protein